MNTDNDAYPQTEYFDTFGKVNAMSGEIVWPPQPNPTTGVTCSCGTVNKRKRWTNRTVLKCTNCKAEIKYVWAEGWQNAEPA